MKTKYILLLILTLLMGILIGSLVTGRFTRQRVDRIKSWNTREGFRNHIFKILQPTESQVLQLIPIIDEFSDRHWLLMKKNWETQNILFNEMDSIIIPYLNDEQFQLLLDHKEKVHKDREEKQAQRNSEP
ncbi:MAG: hypothetical protein CVT92_03800 [Bacteroidetes bacterium HGW-Bacteroidetes-1]|jgi:hypothetical protein|nr:MAG: hypothetical protein CVT92_03800 [Bacteroidetes bacterium HGW-Bacteroidetes-1]